MHHYGDCLEYRSSIAVLKHSACKCSCTACRSKLVYGQLSQLVYGQMSTSVSSYVPVLGRSECRQVEVVVLKEFSCKGGCLKIGYICIVRCWELRFISSRLLRAGSEHICDFFPYQDLLTVQVLVFPCLAAHQHRVHAAHPGSGSLKTFCTQVDLSLCFS